MNCDFLKKMHDNEFKLILSNDYYHECKYELEDNYINTLIKKDVRDEMLEYIEKYNVDIKVENDVLYIDKNLDENVIEWLLKLFYHRELEKHINIILNGKFEDVHCCIMDEWFLNKVEENTKYVGYMMQKY